MEDWTPEKEKKNDPGEMMDKAREIMDRAENLIPKDLKKKAGDLEASYLAHQSAFKLPTLETLVGKPFKLWNKVKEVFSREPFGIQIEVFRQLLHSPWDEDEKKQ